MYITGLSLEKILQNDEPVMELESLLSAHGRSSETGQYWRQKTKWQENEKKVISFMNHL